MISPGETTLKPEMDKRESEEDIVLTRNTLEKIFAYVRGIKEIIGDAECYGFLVAPAKKCDRIVYDAILAPRQIVTGSSANVDEAAAAAAKAEIENLGYRALGFWHNHANFGSWHSGVDDRNLEDLCFDFSGSTEKVEERDRYGGRVTLLENGDLIYLLKEKDIQVRIKPENLNPEEIINLTLKRVGQKGFHYESDERSLHISTDSESFSLAGRLGTVLLTKPEREKISAVGRAYSLIVNFEEETYGEIALMHSCYCCGNSRIERMKDVAVRTVEVEGDVSFTEEQLNREISERVKTHGRYRTLF